MLTTEEMKASLESMRNEIVEKSYEYSMECIRKLRIELVFEVESQKRIHNINMLIAIEFYMVKKRYQKLSNEEVSNVVTFLIFQSVAAYNNVY